MKILHMAWSKITVRETVSLSLLVKLSTIANVKNENFKCPIMKTLKNNGKQNFNNFFVQNVEVLSVFLSFLFTQRKRRKLFWLDFNKIEFLARNWAVSTKGWWMQKNWNPIFQHFFHYLHIKLAFLTSILLSHN